MSLAIVFLGGSFFVELLLSFYYFWTMNEMPETNTKDSQGKFQALGIMAKGLNRSLLLFFVSLIIFFIFYASLMVSTIDSTTTFNSVTYITSQDWMLGWEFLKIMIGLIWINAGVLAWRIMHQTKILVMVFGQQANKERKWNIR